jgi:hypothetical protein
MPGCEAGIDAVDAVTSATRAAYALYLAAARDAVLDRHTASHLTAAPNGPDDELPPNLDAWPPRSVWNTVITKILEAVSRVWNYAWTATLPSDLAPYVAPGDAAQRTHDTIRDQLVGDPFPDHLYDIVRQTVLDANAEHADPAALRERLTTVLTLPTWLARADNSSRNISHTALNSGIYDAGLARQDQLGETLLKIWHAVDDDVTRPAHRDADGQAVPTGHTFDVGGEAMRFPHDPTASIHNTASCRCVLGWLDPTQPASDNLDTTGRNAMTNPGPLAAAGQEPPAAPPATTAPLAEPVTAPGAGTRVTAAATTVPAATEPAAAAPAAAPSAPGAAAAPPAPATAQTVVTEPPPILRADAGNLAWVEQISTNVPMEPDPACFAPPKLSRGTKLAVVNDKGWVAGYIADWDARHRVYDCPPPRDPYGGTYPKFHRHPIRTSDGGRVLTGPIATNGHGDTGEINLWAVQKHYDDPRFVAANVVVGEDENGIWAAGTLRPGVSPFQVALLDTYYQSGHWMSDELVASCCVTVEAFELNPNNQAVAALAAAAGPDQPILASARQHAVRDAEGRCISLTAAGIVTPQLAAASAIDGTTLYRQFKAAQAVDQRVTAARRRALSDPTALAASATRIREGA